MADTLTAEDRDSPAERFQAPDASDLTRMDRPLGIEGLDGIAGELPGGEAVPSAVDDGPAAGAAEPLQKDPVGEPGDAGIAVTDEASEVKTDAAAVASGVPFVLKEEPAGGQIPAARILDRMRPALKAACLIGAVLCVAAGAWWMTQPPRVEPTAPLNRVVEEQPIPAGDPLPGPPEPIQPPANDPLDLEAKLREVDALRQALLVKKAEILQLQQTYDHGVLEVEEDAARLIKRTGIGSPAQALKHRQIELALKSIQRRQAYRDGLHKPLRWIELGSEELLYLKRRAVIDLQLKEIAEHVDLKTHVDEIDTALTKYQPTPENLAVGTPAPANASMDVIWKRLAEQVKLTTVSIDDQQDQEIIDEVCSGYLGRLSELTNLTLRAARCLAESGSMELFMNRLSRISPAPGKILCEWPGQWLCLNGISRLSPDFAGQLAGWPGDRISLNGLSELPVDTAAALAGWNGRHLELMGLSKFNGVEHLARWEAAGGRLYVPDAIRKEMKQFRAAARPAPATAVSGRR